MIQLNLPLPDPDDAAALVEVLIAAAVLDEDRAPLWLHLADGIGDGLDALPPAQPCEPASLHQP